MTVLVKLLVLFSIVEKNKHATWFKLEKNYYTMFVTLQ